MTKNQALNSNSTSLLLTNGDTVPTHPKLYKQGQEEGPQLHRYTKLRRFWAKIGHREGDLEKKGRSVKWHRCGEQRVGGEEWRVAARGDGKGSESEELGPLKLYPEQGDTDFNTYILPTARKRTRGYRRVTTE
jgi:hypothetical protein